MAAWHVVLFTWALVIGGCAAAPRLASRTDPSPESPATASNQTAAPANQSHASANQTPAPTHQTVASNSKTATPANLTASPASQTASPASQTTSPASQTASPANQSAPPANQTAPQANQTASPVVPSTGAVNQTSNTVNETTAAANQTTPSPSATSAGDNATGGAGTTPAATSEPATLAFPLPTVPLEVSPTDSEVEILEPPEDLGPMLPEVEAGETPGQPGSGGGQDKGDYFWGKWNLPSWWRTFVQFGLLSKSRPSYDFFDGNEVPFSGHFSYEGGVPFDGSEPEEPVF